MRLFLVLGLLALLVGVAACAGEESDLCEGLDDLQGSVQDLRDVELEEGALEELRAAADEIEGDVAAVQEAAGDELGDEAAALADAVRGVAAELETATEGEITRESLQALAAQVSGAVTAFDALREAAPECDL